MSQIFGNPLTRRASQNQEGVEICLPGKHAQLPIGLFWVTSGQSETIQSIKTDEDVTLCAYDQLILSKNPDWPIRWTVACLHKCIIGGKHSAGLDNVFRFVFVSWEDCLDTYCKPRQQPKEDSNIRPHVRRCYTPFRTVCGPAYWVTECVVLSVFSSCFIPLLSQHDNIIFLHRGLCIEFYGDELILLSSKASPSWYTFYLRMHYRNLKISWFVVNSN